MQKKELSFLVLAKPRPGLDECVDFLKGHSKKVELLVGDREDPFPLDRCIEWDGEFLLSYLSPWIVPSPVLRNVAVAAINFHPGPPEYPGIGCTNFALYHREREYGVTAHHMVEEVDSGPIIAVRRFPVPPDETVYALTQRCYQEIRSLFKEVVTSYLETGILPISKERWTRRPTTRGDLDRLCAIDLQMSQEEVERRVRATTYPGMPGHYLKTGR